LSRDRPSLRADFVNFFRYASGRASSVSGNVCGLHCRRLVPQHGCTTHVSRGSRPPDGGDREAWYGSRCPRTISAPSSRPTQRQGGTSVCASAAQVRGRGSPMIRRDRSPSMGSRRTRPSPRRGRRATGPPCSSACNDTVSKSSRASCAGRARAGPVRPQARARRSAHP
jgi:hypothetical protein